MRNFKKISEGYTFRPWALKGSGGEKKGWREGNGRGKDCWKGMGRGRKLNGPGKGGKVVSWVFWGMDCRWFKLWLVLTLTSTFSGVHWGISTETQWIIPAMPVKSSKQTADGYQLPKYSLPVASMKNNVSIGVCIFFRIIVLLYSQLCQGKWALSRQMWAYSLMA